MKVDEFITLYKLLTEQSIFTLPFTILAIYGLLELICLLAGKRLFSNGKLNFGIVYTTLLIISLGILILKRNADEDLRKDALSIKQYFDKYGAEYESVYLSSVEKYFPDSLCINQQRIIEIVNRFPNDFTLSIDTSTKPKTFYLVLEDTTIMNKHKRFLENLAYSKLLGSLAMNESRPMFSFSSLDARLTFGLLEKTCARHPTEFVIENTAGNGFRGNIKRIKQCENDNKQQTPTK